VSDQDLVESQRAAILDPFDPEVIAAARASGIDEGWIECAQRSPIYQFVKVWELALPLHPEYRTMAMMFYIPPLSPVVSTIEENLYKLDLSPEQRDFELFNRLDAARLPVKYLASLFTAGNEEIIRSVLRKMLAVRTYMRRKTVDGAIEAETLALLEEAGLTQEQAEGIYHLTTQPTIDERFVLPPYHREMSVESLKDPLAHKGETGLGYLQVPLRGE
jgi:nitrate reductase beta subunit